MGFLNVFQKRAKPAATRPPAATAADSRPRAAEAAPSAGTGQGGRAAGREARTPFAAVLLKRLVTEKATDGAARGQYTFAVAPAANKITVQRAVQQRYGVKPSAVRIINVAPRRVRFGRRQGMTKAWKKAIVQLPPGAKIEGEKPAS